MNERLIFLIEGYPIQGIITIMMPHNSIIVSFFINNILSIRCMNLEKIKNRLFHFAKTIFQA